MSVEAELSFPAAERAVELLTAHDPTAALAGATSDDQEAQALVEVLGLLAYAEPEVPVDPAVRAALMSRVTTPTPQPLMGDGATRGGGDVVPLRPRASQPRRAWTGLLAAALGLCALGLAFLTGQVAEQRDVIARLQDERSALETTDSRINAELQATIASLAKQREALDMVTQVARQAYPLRPTVRSASLTSPASRPPPRGIVFVCGQHQRWYLNVHGLDPAPEGYRYSLWFQTADGPVHAGFMEIEARRDGELSAQTMPRGTRSFMVTLEPPGGSRSAPVGEPVMVAEDAVRL